MNQEGKPHISRQLFYFADIAGEKRTTLITTSTANNDPRVWGEDVGEFKLRDIKMYQKLSTCFAEQAVDKKNPDNSRYCPGKELTFAMMSGRKAYFYRFKDSNHLALHKRKKPFKI